MSKQRVAAFVLCAVAFFGLAGNAQAAGEWTEWTTVSKLYPGSGAFFFTTNYANVNWSSCDNGRRWAIEVSHDNYNVLVATLIAAYMAGKQVQLNITVDSTIPCAGVVNRFFVTD